MAVALATVGGCELSRPEGAFSPPADVPTGPSAPKPPPELDNDELPDLDVGDGTGDDGAADGSPDDADGSEPTPLELLQDELSGDYWMRLDLHSSATSNGMTVNTHTTTYSLVRVGADDSGALKMIDWQCSIVNAQTCSFPCSSASSSVTPGEGRAYRQAVRTVTVDVDTGHWSTTLMPFALGWEGNFAEDPEAALPTSANDPRIYDSAGDGLGVNISVAIKTGISTTNCVAQLVQKVGLAYSGTLVNRAFSQGDVSEKGSDQFVVASSCPPDISADQTAAYTLRLARAPASIDEQWTCPSDAQFRAQLPQP